jgi:hypothetical protein
VRAPVWRNGHGDELIDGRAIRRHPRAPPAPYQTGNGSHPVSSSPQLGCCRLAPRRPHTVHRACWRNTPDENTWSAIVRATLNN